MRLREREGYWFDPVDAVVLVVGILSPALVLPALSSLGLFLAPSLPSMSPVSPPVCLVGLGRCGRMGPS